MSSDKVGGRSFRELMTPARIATLVLIALAAIFIFENTRKVRIRLIIPEVTMRLWAALLIAFVVGLLIGLSLRIGGRRRGRR
nr:MULTISPECIES: lipopolysaccharide assembly protein LapA domain-containing protein [unclassified Streptomyces]